MHDLAEFATRALRAIDAEIHAIEGQLVAGSYTDHVGYRNAVGVRLGLNKARDAVVNALTPNDRKDFRIS